MIQAKGLRKGNIIEVYHSVDGYCEVVVNGIEENGNIQTDAYGTSFGSCDGDVKTARAIPLIEERLIKWGFKKSDHNIWRLLDRSGIPMNIGVLVKKGIATVLFIDSSQFCHIVDHCKEVHRFQNLYFEVYNEELTIKN